MSRELVAARHQAMASGDKAKGREIYHQLIALGYSPEDIDADRLVFPPLEPEVVEAPEAEAVDAVVDAPPVFEHAVQEPSETRED